MKDLSPLAKQLLELGQRDVEPTALDKERVRAGLSARLPVQPPASDTGASAASKAAARQGISWSLVSALVIGAGVVAGGVYWGLSSRTDVRASAPQPSSTVSASPPAAGAMPSASPAVSVEPSAAAVPSPTAPPADSEASPAGLDSAVPDRGRPNNRLGQEVELLSRATSALHAGRADEALRALAEHERMFPRGALTQERRAARAQALCLLGRKSEAARELEQLPASSPQAARARNFCEAR